MQEEKDIEIAKGTHDYSLMNALLKKTDEVNLHSNFIYSMINPNSTHYCGHEFLDLFLKAINEDNFINLVNANVHKEKGKIDLLVEDGEHVLIIENKLRAVDQWYQISRYIQYAIENYLNGDKDNLDEKIHIVYLSEYKKIPSKERESLIGFTLNDNKLTWNNEPIHREVTKKDKTKEKLNLDLPQGTKLNFNRVQHSNELSTWVKTSKGWLFKNKPNTDRKTLMYAFDEYALILKRLKTNQWRKIMMLDEYVLKMVDEEQKEIYSFMCEANNKLNDYLAKKLYEEVNKLFPEKDREELKLSETIFKEFTPDNCKKWFSEKGVREKYKDVGFKFNKEYYFALGVNNIAYGLVANGWKIKTSRNKLKDNNLFDLIENLKKLDNKCPYN